jgi:hypothetical protein
MTVSSLNIKISVLHETKNNEEWVAQKKTNFWGNKTTIKFYQREKSQSNFQKLADFLTGVKPGREVAAKYINELGLNKTVSNPKNKSASLTDTDLNNAFQSAAKKMETRVAFESTEPLVSRQGTDSKNVNIEINSKKIQNANTYREILKAEEYVFFSSQIQGSDRTASKNKISIESISVAIDIRENSSHPISPEEVTKAHLELTAFKKASNGQSWFNPELSSRLDSLINALENKLPILKQTSQT